MHQKIIIFAFFALLNHLVLASDDYTPLFDHQSNNEINHTLLGDYKKATESKDIRSATKNWEEFLYNYSYGAPVDFEDLTHLIYVRQAHFELARLYYLQKSIKKADALIIKASSFTVYSRPQLNNGARWCILQGYCK